MLSTLAPPLAEPRCTRLDRALAVFADVRAGEGVGALLLAANVFCLLTFYSVLKIVREALILSEGGAEIGYSDRGRVTRENRTQCHRRGARVVGRADRLVLQAHRTRVASGGLERMPDADTSKGS